ncbi:hypothetical protein [Pedobacter sp. GR22-10]|nr:hypothetical protein [Pedobacter sp. GR22-10]MCX2431109.1 hypothetical protein [Pedobacter sp. GR22-10]
MTKRRDGVLFFVSLDSAEYLSTYLLALSHATNHKLKSERSTL